MRSIIFAIFAFTFISGGWAYAKEGDRLYSSVLPEQCFGGGKKLYLFISNFLDESSYGKYWVAQGDVRNGKFFAGQGYAAPGQRRYFRSRRGNEGGFQFLVESTANNNKINFLPLSGRRAFGSEDKPGRISNCQSAVELSLDQTFAKEVAEFRAIIQNPRQFNSAERLIEIYQNLPFPNQEIFYKHIGMTKETAAELLGDYRDYWESAAISTAVDVFNLPYTDNNREVAKSRIARFEEIATLGVPYRQGIFSSDNYFYYKSMDLLNFTFATWLEVAGAKHSFGSIGDQTRDRCDYFERNKINYPAAVFRATGIPFAYLSINMVRKLIRLAVECQTEYGEKAARNATSFISSIEDDFAGEKEMRRVGSRFISKIQDWTTAEPTSSLMLQADGFEIDPDHYEAVNPTELLSTTLFSPITIALRERVLRTNIGKTHDFFRVTDPLEILPRDAQDACAKFAQTDLRLAKVRRILKINHLQYILPICKDEAASYVSRAAPVLGTTRAEELLADGLSGLEILSLGPDVVPRGIVEDATPSGERRAISAAQELLLPVLQAESGSLIQSLESKIEINDPFTKVNPDYETACSEYLRSTANRKEDASIAELASRIGESCETYLRKLSHAKWNLVLDRLGNLVEDNKAEGLLGEDAFQIIGFLNGQMGGSVEGIEEERIETTLVRLQQAQLNSVATLHDKVDIKSSEPSDLYEFCASVSDLENYHDLDTLVGKACSESLKAVSLAQREAVYDTAITIDPLGSDAQSFLSDCEALEASGTFHNRMCAQPYSELRSRATEKFTAEVSSVAPFSPEAFKLESLCRESRLLQYSTGKSSCQAGLESLFHARISILDAVFSEAVPFEKSEDVAISVCKTVRERDLGFRLEASCAAHERRLADRRQEMECKAYINRSDLDVDILNARIDIGNGKTMDVSSAICGGFANKPRLFLEFSTRGFLRKTLEIAVRDEAGNTRYKAAFSKRQTGIGPVYFVSEVQKVQNTWPTNMEPGMVLACEASLSNCAR